MTKYVSGDFLQELEKAKKELESKLQDTEYEQA